MWWLMCIVCEQCSLVDAPFPKPQFHKKTAKLNSTQCNALTYKRAIPAKTIM